MIYSAGVYLRLSRDDSDIDGISKLESNSIAGQRQLIEAYLKEWDNIMVYDTYIDDGYTGINFERPEFRRLLLDIENKRVNCVITKDLSRFGRDYIETGRYLQRIFPALKVRFIAVADNYDSLSADMGEQSLLLPVRNFINDSYCRDISTKVRAHQLIKRIEGDLLAPFAVYGYKKSKEDNNKLVIDDYPAGIVKMIYNMKMSGISLAKIAGRLDANGILSPSEYKKQCGFRYETGFLKNARATWSATAVRRILTNRVYIGYMEQGKTEKLSYKLDKRINRPSCEWVVVKNTHEPIISEMEYDIVQDVLRYDTRAKGVAANRYTGTVFCFDCGRPMIIKRNNKKTYYICQTKNKAIGCSRHAIAESDLDKIVMYALNNQLKALTGGDILFEKPDFRLIKTMLYKILIHEGKEIDIFFRFGE